jgi:Ankyrin repeats (3 copies)
MSQSTSEMVQYLDENGWCGMLHHDALKHGFRRDRAVGLWIAVFGLFAFIGGSYASQYGPNAPGNDFCDQVNSAIIANDTKHLHSILAEHSVGKWSHAQSECLENALRAAASMGRDKIVAELLSAKVNPNACTPAGGTALMHIAGHEHSASIARLLITAGADATLRDNDGFTAADRAIQEGDIELIQLLHDKSHEMKQ